MAELRVVDLLPYLTHPQRLSELAMIEKREEHILLCRDALIADVVTAATQFREYKKKNPRSWKEQFENVRNVVFEESDKKELFLGFAVSFGAATIGTSKALWNHLNQNISVDSKNCGRVWETKFGDFKLGVSSVSPLDVSLMMRV